MGGGKILRGKFLFYNVIVCRSYALFTEFRIFCHYVLVIRKEKVLGVNCLFCLVIGASGDDPRRRFFTCISVIAAWIWRMEVLGGEMVSICARLGYVIVSFDFCWSFDYVGFDGPRQIWWIEILGGEVVSVYVHSKTERVDVG